MMKDCNYREIEKGRNYRNELEAQGRYEGDEKP